MLRSRLFVEWGVIALLATILVSLAVMSGATRRFDNLLYDAAAVWRAPPADDRILIVEIDNRSLASIGKWPWSRDNHAQLINRLADAGAKVIAYDVLFVEPASPAEDSALAQAMAQHGNVILPVLYDTPGSNGADHDIILPVQSLARAASNMGSVNLLFDEDGLVRRAQIETRSDQGRFEHLMEQTYRVTTGKASPAFTKVTAANDVDSILIPFQKAGSFRRVSFASMVAGEVPAQFVKGKIVLVGMTADGQGDRHPVAAAVGSTMSGVEIQANLLNGLLNNRFIQAAPLWARIVGALLPVWLLLLMFLRWRPTSNLIASVAMIGAVIGIAAIGVALFGSWMPPGPALLGLLLVYPLWGWRRLEALSSFVFEEAQTLKAEAGLSMIIQDRSGGLDSVAAEAQQLRAVIGELRGVRRFMSDVVSGFPDAICVVDQDMRVTLANAAASSVLGEGIKGRQIAELLNQASPGTSAGADEINLPDGRTFLIRTVPLSADAGRDAGSIIRFADITRLREADQEREEVLEFLSHDMRAPQAAIISLLETSKDQVDPTLWQRIQDNARKTLKLADDFVQSARLSAATLEMQEVNIAGALAEALDLVWPEANRKGIRLVRQNLDAEAFVMGDHSALTRAFTNLIDNAVKYSRSESAVTASVEPGEPGMIVCTIADQGPGLPLLRKAALFARFGARGEDGPAGSGLGLAYVKKVVDRHGGVIDWASDSGQGTRFKLIFPVVAISEPIE